jgi:hypothetical protein
MPDASCLELKEKQPQTDQASFSNAALDLLAQLNPSAQLLAAWALYGLTVDFKQMQKLSKVGRNKAYELQKEDEAFPLGIPIYDGDKSPKFFWTHEVVAWIEARDAKARTKRKNSNERKRKCR